MAKSKQSMLPKVIPVSAFITSPGGAVNLDPGNIFFKELRAAGQWPKEWPDKPKALVELGVTLLSLNSQEEYKKESDKDWGIVFDNPLTNKRLIALNKEKVRRKSPLIFHYLTLNKELLNG